MWPAGQGASIIALDRAFDCGGGIAKSAVMRLTESLSKEVRHQGINVNAVLPVAGLS